MNTENKNNFENKKAKPNEPGLTDNKNSNQPNEENAAETSAASQQKSRGPRKPPPRKRETVPSEFVEQVVSINRITKVTKGGKRLSFSALVVVGDTKGRVGYSFSKANEVAIAIKKSLIAAKKNMITVPMDKSTITHQINGVCGGAEVMLKPAAEGTGVIAAGPVRAVCDSAGIRNILTKCHRSNNPINVVKATIDGLSRLKQRQPSATPVSASGVKADVPSSDKKS